MTLGDEYRVKAAYMDATARQEKNLAMRTEFENLALVYRRLAIQADRQGKTRVVYDAPSIQANVEG